MTTVGDAYADGSEPGFADVWKRTDVVPGWLTRDQAHDLWSAALAMPPGGTAVEIGSHQGRSTIAMASAAAARGATVVAVDPFVDGAMFGGARTRDLFLRHLDAAGLAAAVRLETDYSTRVQSRWIGGVDLLFIDGKHDYWSCTRDIDWVDQMAQGAPVFVHDAFSSLGVTASMLREQLRRRPRLRYRGRTGSLAHFIVGTPSIRERLSVAGEFGWFARNAAVKLSLRLKLPSVAGFLGHHSPHDPY